MTLARFLEQPHPIKNPSFLKEGLNLFNEIRENREIFEKRGESVCYLYKNRLLFIQC